MSFSAIIDKIYGLLQGEPARVIGYGAAVIIWIVAKAVGVIPDQTFDQAVATAFAELAVVVSIIETIRHIVYSPATVAAITTPPPA